MLPTAPLVGDEFIAKWRTRSTNDLLGQLRTTMPPESPGSLGEDGYLGVMAYILQRNGNAPSDDRLLAASGESIAAGAGGGAAGAAAVAPRPAGLLVKGTVAEFRAGQRPGAAQPCARRLADDPPRLQREQFQPAVADCGRQREPAPARVDLADARRRHEPARAARLPRHDLPEQSPTASCRRSTRATAA